MKNPTCRLYIQCDTADIYLACTRTLMQHKIGYYVCSRGHTIRVKSRSHDKIRDIEVSCRYLGAKTERHYDP